MESPESLYAPQDFAFNNLFFTVCFTNSSFLLSHLYISTKYAYIVIYAIWYAL